MAQGLAHCSSRPRVSFSHPVFRARMRSWPRISDTASGVTFSRNEPAVKRLPHHRRNRGVFLFSFSFLLHLYPTTGAQHSSGARAFLSFSPAFSSSRTMVCRLARPARPDCSCPRWCLLSFAQGVHGFLSDGPMADGESAVSEHRNGVFFQCVVGYFGRFCRLNENMVLPHFARHSQCYSHFVRHVDARKIGSV